MMEEKQTTAEIMIQEGRNRKWREVKGKLKHLNIKYGVLIVQESLIALLEKLKEEILYSEFTETKKVPSNAELLAKKGAISDRFSRYALYHCMVGSSPFGATSENPSGDSSLLWDSPDEMMQKLLDNLEAKLEKPN